MPGRLVEGAAASVERLLGSLSGPTLHDAPSQYAPPADGQPSGSGETDFKCPVCNAPRNDYGGERDQYDEDYDYYWGEFRIPLWMALIWQVPWRQRLDIFVIGFILGMVIAGLALLWGFVLSQY
jgi:hypothetical protein